MKNDFHSVIDIYQSLTNADLQESAFDGFIYLTEESKKILSSLLNTKDFLYVIYNKDDEDKEDEIFNSKMDSSADLQI